MIYPRCLMLRVEWMTCASNIVTLLRCSLWPNN